MEVIENSEITQMSVEPERILDVKMEENDHRDRSENANFSSENFKIIIHNVPRYKGVKQVKNYIKQQTGGLLARKVIVKEDHAYVTFNNEEDRQKAISKLTNIVWKGCSLRVKRADAVQDPIQQKRIKNETTIDEKVVDYTAALLTSTTPLANEPYERQLVIKQAASLKLLINLSRQIRQVSVDKDIGKDKEYYGTLEKIKPSPIINGYRNKCEFTVGFNVDNQAEVGFRISRYRDGGYVVVPIDDCPHVPNMVKKFVSHFVSFVRQSDRPAYDVIRKEGFWKMLTTKFFKFDFMVIVTVNPQFVSADDMNRVKSVLVETFLKCNIELGYRITSLFLSAVVNQSDSPNYEHIGGVPYVYETLLGCRFRISPATFFQTNTASCEVLYSTLHTLTKLTKETLLLDICCGAGTIGITMADRVKKVVGIELIDEAVVDARVNAVCNEKVNCQFISGKAEDVFESFRRTKLIDFDEYDNVVAVLDPPRKGLGDKIVSCVRECRKISSVIYVSCDPKAATKNFLDLCRLTSNRYPGIGFKLTTVVPVDMFPHTSHFEWLLLFQREN